jgi:hypothetical protein
MAVYQAFVDIVRKGDWRNGKGDNGKGWGGKVGYFHGGMTFQGIIPYYYDYLHVGQAVELNRCVYNQMADNPKDEPKGKEKVTDGPFPCRTNQTECEDCRVRPFEDVVSSHFTECQKPWLCLPQDVNTVRRQLCRELHHEWYTVRSDLEKSWGRSGMGPGTWQMDHFFGYCKRMGKIGYQKIAQPYGQPAEYK